MSLSNEQKRELAEKVTKKNDLEKARGLLALALPELAERLDVIGLEEFEIKIKETFKR